MSRSGYSDDVDDYIPPEFWESAVIRAANGKRGQAFLRKLAAHMDAMPVKRLVAYDWVTQDGEACALGVVLQAERPDLAERSKAWDPDDEYPVQVVARQLDIAQSLAQEIVYVNDERSRRAETPEDRWTRVRQWVEGCLHTPAPNPPEVLK